MCTIIFAYGVFEGFALASNRDESYGRSFLPPSVTTHADGWHIAPTDDREGGTWVGYNEAGVVVTLSNLPVYDDETRSRGKLCGDLLRTSSVDEARSLLRETYERHDYEGFNVVVGSPNDCFVGVNDGELRVVEPENGVHVATNSAFDDPGKKASAVATELSPPEEYATQEDWLDETRTVLSSHDPEVCVHDPGHDFVVSRLRTRRHSGGVVPVRRRTPV
jgi:uncharacterized protein with NRDE domain